MLKGAVVAQNPELELNLKHAKTTLDKRLSDSLPKSAVHCPLRLLVLISLIFGELKLTQPVDTIWQMEQVFCASETNRVQE
jgi:hypothetical protein